MKARTKDVRDSPLIPDRKMKPTRSIYRNATTPWKLKMSRPSRSETKRIQIDMPLVKKLAAARDGMPYHAASEKMALRNCSDLGTLIAAEALSCGQENRDLAEPGLMEPSPPFERWGRHNKQSWNSHVTILS